jgi:hypothetical protein
MSSSFSAPSFRADAERLSTRSVNVISCVSPGVQCERKGWGPRRRQYFHTSTEGNVLYALSRVNAKGATPPSVLQKEAACIHSLV